MIKDCTISMIRTYKKEESEQYLKDIFWCRNYTDVDCLLVRYKDDYYFGFSKYFDGFAKDYKMSNEEAINYMESRARSYSKMEEFAGADFLVVEDCDGAGHKELVILFPLGTGTGALKTAASILKDTLYDRNAHLVTIAMSVEKVVKKTFFATEGQYQALVYEGMNPFHDELDELLHLPSVLNKCTEEYDYAVFDGEDGQKIQDWDN